MHSLAVKRTDESSVANGDTVLLGVLGCTFFKARLLGSSGLKKDESSTDMRHICRCIYF